ncbi:MAG: HEAT repeat domain-containing protein [Phycisphaerae bacterium]|nr:HEAT repeat domain-containing protein [Phycisphaerae bacterium]
MYRMLSLGVMVALLGSLMGCASSGEPQARSRWSGGSTPPGYQWGEGLTSLWDSSTYNTQVLQACHDLYDGKMAITRVNAAKRLGELKPTSNFAVERLERGMKDRVMEVRIASALALQEIGTDGAMRHLKEAQEKGQVPCDLPTSAGQGSAFQGDNTPSDSTETTVEVKARKD